MGETTSDREASAAPRGAGLAALMAIAPTPLADAIAALLGAESAFEQRDRVVEVFRVELRLVAALVLAARLQLGPGPEPEAPQVAELLRQLRGRGLTDGQWVALVRELLRPWAATPNAHALPMLVSMVMGRKSELLKLWDELLVMRKSETVAHGATGTREALGAILERRTPQLTRTLELLRPLFALRLVVPRAGEPGAPRSAVALVGVTPPLGRFPRVSLEEASASLALADDQPLLLDGAGRPVLALAPIALVRAPHERAPAELFLLDGPAKRGALYVAFPSMAEHRDPEAWAALDAVLEAEDAPPASSPGTGLPERPYRGLGSFGAEEAALFFGREEQAEALANRIRRYGFVTVTGQSGSGKTSLLRAGVLPLFRDAAVAFVRPGVHPMASLVSRVAESLELARDEVAACAEEPGRLRALVADATQKVGAPFILVVDQAEELLTLTRDEAEREAFARALAVLGQGDGVSHVVISVREDFFARLASVKALFGLFSQHVEVVTTPDRDALIRILIGPAKAFGYSFEDEALVLGIVDAVGGASAALALLSFTADRLWEGRDRRWKQLTHKAHEAIGGALGALATHAEAIVSKLSTSELAACRALLSRLVTGERTRAVVPRADLLEAARDAAETERVLDRLVAARLLSTSEDESGAAQVELVHEALLAHWSRLDRWLSEDAEGQRVAHALRQAAKEWDGRARARGLLWRGELLDDLTRFARRPDLALTETERAFIDACAREARRQSRLRVGLVAGAFVATALFGVFMFFQWRAAEASRREAEQERRTASEQKLKAEVRGLVAEARSVEARGRSDDALALVRAASAIEGELGLPDATEESRDLARLEAAGAGAIVLAGASRPLRLLATSLAHQRVFAGGADEDVLVFDAERGELVARLDYSGTLVDAIVTSPGERFVAIRASNQRGRGVVRVYELPSLRPVLEREGAPTKKLAFAPDDALLAIVDHEDDLLLFDTATFAAPTKAEGLRGAILDLQVGRDVVVATTAKATAMWSYSGRSLGELAAPEGQKLSHVAISPDGKTLARALEKEVVLAQRLDDGGAPREVSRGKGLVASLRFVDDERLLVGYHEAGLRLAMTTPKRPVTPHALASIDTGSGAPSYAVHDHTLAVVIKDKWVDVFDLDTGARRLRRGGHETELSTVALLGDRPVTAGWDKLARVWPAARKAPVTRTLELASGVKSVARSADREHIVVAHGDRATSLASLTWFEPKSGTRRVLSPGVSDGRLVDHALDGDGRRVAAAIAAKADAAGTLSLIDVASAAPTASIELSDEPTAFAASSDLSVLVAGDKGGALRVWRPSGGHELRTISVHEGIIHRVALSPDASLVASVGFDRTARVTRLEDGAPVLELPITAAAAQLVFAPDGRSLAIGDYGSVLLFHVDDAGELAPFDGIDLEDQSAFDLCFAPDGTRLAVSTSANGEGGVIVADLALGERTKLKPPENVSSLDFSRDGRRLLGAGNEGSLLLWTDGRDPVIAVSTGDEALLEARFFGNDDAAVGLGFPASLPIIDTHLATRVEALEAGASHSNLRVCRQTLAVVAELDPPPGPWARDEDCTAR